MKNLKSLFFSLALIVALSSNAKSWMRFSAISPDGNTVAFCYKGDIYTVPTTGGNAFRITSNMAYDSEPKWSLDGEKILFKSDRKGGFDLFVVSKKGGTPTRITTFSGDEQPLAFLDSTRILFSANIMPAKESFQFPSSTFKQVYEVNINGGRPKMFSPTTMEMISIKSDGTILYTDKKGYENEWRKHETSSRSRDIWTYDPKTTKYAQQTDFYGEDRNAVWIPNENAFYYLSEKNGSFNVFRKNIGEAGSGKQITKYSKNPVRFLTIANNGTLCYGFNGDIFVLNKSSEPQKLAININVDQNDSKLQKNIFMSSASEMAVSPNDKEVAFIVQGDIYVTSIEYNTTKQITNTPEQERDIDFSPDGRSLVYSSERNGLWQLYITSLTNKDEKEFTYATEMKEERLTESNKASFQPSFSPDGKEVAFLENRTTLKVIKVKNHKDRVVMDGKYQYSYMDGDQWYQWSPDGKWFLTDFIGIGGWNNKDVALVKADGKGEIYNLTQSGYSDSRAKWALDGKAIVWTSDRAGYRSHGSWGSERDAYMMFLDVDAYKTFLMSKEDLEREKMAKAHSEKRKAEDGEEKPKKEKVDKLSFDLKHCRERVVRLTPNSSNLGDVLLTKDASKVYYLTSFEGGMDLWMHDLKNHSSRIVIKGLGGGRMILNKKQNAFFMCSGGLKMVSLGSNRVKNIGFRAEFEYKPYQERNYIFDHAWRQTKDKFFRKDMNGADWNWCRKNYEPFLASISNGYDFADLLSEMLGELNASHTGARYHGRGAQFSTASLGCFFDESYEKEGLLISEVIERSPLSLMPELVSAGCVIEKIDGKEILPGEDYFPLLAGKSNQKVRLSVYNPHRHKHLDVTVRAISSGELSGLLYKRWVDRNKEFVAKKSNNRVGYIHIQAMNSASFHTLYSELLGKYRNCDAVVIDTRHNGGGWLHDDVCTLLSGKEYLKFTPRGQYIGTDPFMKWCKPSCMLVCEDNYSNAHGTPWLYKELKIGKLIGSPVPGTMTAVWWEQQVNPALVFGIPQVTCTDMRGNCLENEELKPDILVYNNEKTLQKGFDEQLMKAVETMLGTIDTTSTK